MPSGNRMDKTREEKIKELLVLHLLKELSQEQAGELDSWRKESPENEDLFKRISDPDYLEKRHKDYLERPEAFGGGSLLQPEPLRRCSLQ